MGGFRTMVFGFMVPFPGHKLVSEPYLAVVLVFRERPRCVKHTATPRDTSEEIDLEDPRAVAAKAE